MNIEIDLAPCPDHQLVARTDDVIGGDRNVVHGSKCAGHVFKKTGAVNGKHVAQRSLHHLLEVGQFHLLLWLWELNLEAAGSSCLRRGTPILQQDHWVL